METIREIARLLEDIPFMLCLLLIVNVIFIVGAMRNLFRIKKGWRGFLPAIATAFLASGTVVYIGDWGNLPLTFVVLLVLIWVCSEDDGWKKMTVGLLWAIRVLARQRRLEQEALSAKLNEAYYESMEQQHFELRRLRHDMANHLQALSALPSEKKDTYIRELLDSGALAKTLNYCGDPTLNAVLSVKENLLRQQNISLELKLDIPEELPFEKADLCAIYANALDNAAEACASLPEEKPETTKAEPRANNTKNRTIILESRARKGMLVFQTTNPVPENVLGQRAGISV